MNEDRSDALKYLLAGFLGSLLLLWILSHAFRPKDPNTELAKTAREAIEMADDARRDAEIARRASSALRIIALVTGTTAPLVVAYLIYRLQSRQEPTALEMLEMLEQEKLIDLGQDRKTKLPSAEPRLLQRPPGRQQPDKK